jgi:ABC-type uncharacterized transport system permease subunit
VSLSERADAIVVISGKNELLNYPACCTLPVARYTVTMILASPTLTSTFLPLIAAAAYAWPALRARALAPQVAQSWVVVAWLLHGILLAYGLLGESARFGFAPALSMTLWLVAAVYAIEHRLYPQLHTQWPLFAVCAAAVVLAGLFPGHPMPSTATLWLPLHLALGIASYGLFGMAVVHAALLTRTEARLRQAAAPPTGLPLLTLERLTFRFVLAGFVLLSATLVMGWFFGDVVYGSGHAWRWNHKSVFSVLSWGTFAALLVGRFGFGWRGKRAVVFLYIGSALLMLAYMGSRFVLEVILERST